MANVSKSGIRQYWIFSNLKDKTHQEYEGTVAHLNTTALAACRCQLSHLPVLVDCFGDPFWTKIFSDSFMQ